MKDSNDFSLLKVLLVQMASQASINSMISTGPLLPDGWVRLTMFGGKPPKPTVPVQGFLAVGPFNEDGDLAVVLALGVTWDNYIKYNNFGFPPTTTGMTTLPASIIGSAPGAQLLYVYASAYTAARKDIWNCLTFLPQQYQDLPFYITGMGLGSPIAQIGSIDLRSENTGPNGEAPPGVPAPGYVFSAPNFANNTFVNYFKSLITNNKLTPQYVVWAATNSIIADSFPAKPQSLDYSRLGQLQYMSSITLPAYDVPWWERSDAYYLQQLGGIPIATPVIPTSFSNQPEGFSQVLASTLSLMVAFTYQIAQHPNSIVDLNISPYTLYKTINSNGVPYACIFTSSDTVVVAFRGTTTFEEFYASTCLSTFSSVSFMPDQTAQVHSGAYAIYSAPIADGSPTLFSAALLTELKSIAKNKKLYVTGHDIGGAIAGIAATDYSVNNYGFTLTSLYTFGSSLFAGIIFNNNYFGPLVSAKSYQVMRLKDKMGNAILSLGYFPVGNQIIMNGQLAIEESTYHSLAGYIKLLNPF